MVAWENFKERKASILPRIAAYCMLPWITAYCTRPRITLLSGSKWPPPSRGGHSLGPYCNPKRFRSGSELLYVSSSNFYMYVPSPNGQSQGAREIVVHKCTPRTSVQKFIYDLALSKEIRYVCSSKTLIRKNIPIYIVSGKRTTVPRGGSYNIMNLPISSSLLQCYIGGMVVLSMTLFGYWRVKVVDIIAMDIRVKRMELCRLQSDGTGFLYISVQEALLNLQNFWDICFQKLFLQFSTRLHY